MRFLITLTIVLSFSTCCLGQIYNDLVNDTTIKGFMRWKLYEDTFENINVSKEYFSFSSSILKWQLIELKWDSTVSTAQNNTRCIFNQRNKWIDTLITADDKKFIVQQSLSYKASKWLIESPSNTMAKKGYYYLSLPLFSFDRQFAFLKEFYHCGENCGEVRIMMYKYSQKSGWSFYKYLNGGVF